MNYIIEEPIIKDNSIVVRAHLENRPSCNITVEETGISDKDIEQKLIWNLQILATKIARHKLGQLEWE